jgi:DNA replication and repair protein RecF
VYLKNLELKNYRNYDHVDLEFDKDSILLVGNNGNGKTNLLEAVHYISTGRSHRTHVQDELIKWGSDYFLLRGTIVSGNSKRKHLVEVEARKGSSLKIKVDGVYRKKKTDFISILPSVIFSPDDLRIIKADPGERRTFLDSILEVVQKDFSSLRLQYQKILTQRNSLLKSATGSLNSSHLKTLDAWNDNLVRYGLDMVIRRIELLESIKEVFAGHIGSFFKGVSPRIRYVFSWERNGKNGQLENNISFTANSSETGNIQVDRQELARIFKSKLTENLEQDLIRKSTTVGPHRDDIAISFDERDIRSFGSQGQQRVAAISLKLCEIQVLKDRLSTDPVLLLDDVLSELDIQRRKKLVDIINGRFQTFVTATNISYLDKLDIDFGSRFLVKDDTITKMSL